MDTQNIQGESSCWIAFMTLMPFSTKWDHARCQEYHYRVHGWGGMLEYPGRIKKTLVFSSCKFCALIHPSIHTYIQTQHTHNALIHRSPKGLDWLLGLCASSIHQNRGALSHRWIRYRMVASTWLHGRAASDLLTTHHIMLHSFHLSLSWIEKRHV